MRRARNRVGAENQEANQEVKKREERSDVNRAAGVEAGVEVGAGAEVVVIVEVTHPTVCRMGLIHWITVRIIMEADTITDIAMAAEVASIAARYCFWG